MKKLLIVVIVFIVILGVSPKFIGSMVAQERENKITQLNDVDGFDVRNISYTPSWFGAQSSLEVTLQIAEEGLGEITVVVDEDISFGPLIFAQNGWYFALGHSVISFRSSDDVVDGEIVDDEVIAFINKNIHTSATYTFSNNVVANINTDKFDFEDGETKLSAQPASGQFSLINKKDIVGELNWGGLDLKSSEGHLIIGAVSMDTQQSIVSGDYLQGTAIMSGDAKFLVESVHISDISNKEVFTLSQLLLTTSVTIEDELLALSLNYGAENIITMGKTFTKPNLEVVFDNLDLTVIQELNVLVANMPSDSTEQDVSAALSTAIPEFADKLLAKDPTLKITDLSLISEQGKIASELTVRIDKDRFDSQNLMSVMSALVADASGSAPFAFFTQFGLTPMIDGLVEQGYIIKKAEELSFMANYSEAKLVVNGKSIQL